mgnify:FL=1
MEARVAQLESDVAHLLTNVAEIKIDLRALRQRVDERFDHLESKFDAKFDSLESKIDARFVAVDARFQSVDAKFGSLESKIDARFVAVDARFQSVDGKFDSLEAKLDAKLDNRFAWLLSIQLATTAGLLGAMARGFGWL